MRFFTSRAFAVAAVSLFSAYSCVCSDTPEDDGLLPHAAKDIAAAARQTPVKIVIKVFLIVFFFIEGRYAAR